MRWVGYSVRSLLDEYDHILKTNAVIWKAPVGKAKLGSEGEPFRSRLTV